MSIGFPGAFVGGVLTPLRPCSVMLLPAFFSYAFSVATVSGNALYGALVLLLFAAGMALPLLAFGPAVGTPALRPAARAPQAGGHRPPVEHLDRHHRRGTDHRFRRTLPTSMSEEWSAKPGPCRAAPPAAGKPGWIMENPISCDLASMNSATTSTTSDRSGAMLSIRWRRMSSTP